MVFGTTIVARKKRYAFMSEKSRGAKSFDTTRATVAAIISSDGSNSNAHLTFLTFPSLFLLTYRLKSHVSDSIIANNIGMNILVIISPLLSD